MGLLKTIKQSYYLGRHDVSVYKKNGIYMMQWKNYHFNIPDSLDISIKNYLHREFQWKATKDELAQFQSWLGSNYSEDLTNLDVIKEQAMTL